MQRGGGILTPPGKQQSAARVVSIDIGSLFPVPAKQIFTVTTQKQFDDVVYRNDSLYFKVDSNSNPMIYNITPHILKISGSSPSSKLVLDNCGGIINFGDITLENVDMRNCTISTQQSRHINGVNLGMTDTGSISVKNSNLNDAIMKVSKISLDNSTLKNASFTNSVRELNVSNSNLDISVIGQLEKSTISNSTITGYDLSVLDLNTVGIVKLVDMSLSVLRTASGSGVGLEYTVKDKIGTAILPNTASSGYIKAKYLGGITNATPGVIEAKGKNHTLYFYTMEKLNANSVERIVGMYNRTNSRTKEITISGLLDNKLDSNNNLVPTYEILSDGRVKLLPINKHYNLLRSSGIVDSNGILDLQKLENTAKYANEDIYGETVTRINVNDSSLSTDGDFALDMDSEFISTSGGVIVMDDDLIFGGDIKLEYQAAQIQKNQAAINLAHTALSQTRFAYTLEINNMTKRLGETRGLEGEQGVWLRSYIGKGSYKDYEDISYYQTSIGADKYISDDTLLGFSFGYSKQDLSKDIKGTQDTYILTAYGTKFFNNGAYVDGVAKYLRSKGEYENNLLGNIVDNKLNSKPQNAFLLSLEAGYRFDIYKYLTLEPQAELITGYIPENTITSDRVVIKSNAYIPLNIKAGVNTIYKPNDKLDLRVGLGGIADLNDGKVEYDVEDSFVKDTTTTGKDSRIYTNIFGSYKLNNKTRINLELEKTFGGDFNVDYNANFNIRYQF